MQHFGDRIEFIRDYLRAIFAGDVHSKRIDSLAGATLGVMTSASLAVSVIGHALAQARCRLTKHAIKQVDRLLSNQGVVVWDMFGPWVTEMVGQRRSIVVAMDWTDFDADDQTTLALNLVTNHGRATPLLWLTVFKGELKAKRNDYEDLCLLRLAEALPEGIAVVTILADRGFGDVKLFAFGTNWALTMSSGSAAISMSRRPMARPASPRTGSARAVGRATFSAASVTAGGREVGAVVCVHAKDMKEAWCLATSHAEASARQIINSYAKRWTIEPGFATRRTFASAWGWVSCAISKSPNGATGCFSSTPSRSFS